MWVLSMNGHQNAGRKVSPWVSWSKGGLTQDRRHQIRSAWLCPASLETFQVWQWSHWGFSRASCPCASPNVHPQPPKVQLMTFPPASGFGFGFFPVSGFGHTAYSKDLKPCCTCIGVQCLVTSPFHPFICIPLGQDFRALLEIKSEPKHQGSPSPPSLFTFSFPQLEKEVLSS